ncbi:hypothetical protein BT69DRAFT_1353965 [Atractiella rhizophila]|nr:hypothetical protein BT69DRAFT_1353965 [Atractiella rhizophila]
MSSWVSFLRLPNLFKKSSTSSDTVAAPTTKKIKVTAKDGWILGKAAPAAPIVEDSVYSKIWWKTSTTWEDLEREWIYMMDQWGPRERVSDDPLEPRWKKRQAAFRNQKLEPIDFTPLPKYSLPVIVHAVTQLFAPTPKYDDLPPLVPLHFEDEEFEDDYYDDDNEYEDSIGVTEGDEKSIVDPFHIDQRMAVVEAVRFTLWQMMKRSSKQQPAEQLVAVEHRSHVV